METREYRTIDKSAWAPGPWGAEPDKKQWQDRATGYPCLIHRGPSGALCGYVGVAEGHPSFKKDYDDVSVNVHGGLTYSDMCQPGEDESHGICHVPAAGEPDHVWWLGFDCAHYGDQCPAHTMTSSIMGAGFYRDLAYVEDQCARLAAQLKAMEGMAV